MLNWYAINPLFAAAEFDFERHSVEVKLQEHGKPSKIEFTEEQFEQFLRMIKTQDRIISCIDDKGNGSSLLVKSCSSSTQLISDQLVIKTYREILKQQFDTMCQL